MTLTRLLEIDRSLLDANDQRSMALAERMWVEAGMPSEPSLLAVALEQILRSLVEIGVGYPPILLKRKKQLDRQEWKPAPTATAALSPQVTTCAKCRGSGLVELPNGSGTFCGCEAGARVKFPGRARSQSAGGSAS
jgi:hypothetical protein